MKELIRESVFSMWAKHSSFNSVGDNSWFDIRLAISVIDLNNNSVGIGSSQKDSSLKVEATSLCVNR